MTIKIKAHPTIKKNTFRFILMFLALWVIIGFNTKIADIDNYLLFYSFAQRGIRYPGIEIGYYFFMRICASLGCDYYVFFEIYSFLAILLITKSIFDYTDKTFLSIVLFIYFPYFFLVVAVRNLMGGAISLFAIRFLMNNKSKRKSRMLYIIFILIAASFHVSSLLYLLFLFVDAGEKRIRRLTITFLIFGALVVTVGQPALNLIYRFIPKLSIYLGNGLSGTRPITKVFLFFYFGLKLLLSEALYGYDQPNKKVLWGINLLTCVVLPFSIFSMNFMRLEYYMVPIFLIFGINAKLSSSRQSDATSFRITKLLFYSFYIVSGYVLLYIFSFDSVVMQVLQNNSLFGGLFK